MEKGYIKMKTLVDMKKGEKAKINCLNCGYGAKHRLCSLGVLQGQEVEIIKNDDKGPLIIKVFDSKLAIGRGQARKIHIKC